MFSVTRKETSGYTGQYQVGCNAEFVSYDGEGFERFGGSLVEAIDMAAVAILDFSNKDDVSDLAKNPAQLPAGEKTEYLSFTRHHSSIIPQGIGLKFPNLQHFMFSIGTLSKISRKDLKQFPKALSFEFKDNKLEYLEEDVFADNSKLLYVELEDNNIMQVSANIGLFRMKKLFYIHLERNRCINEVFKCKDCNDDELAQNLKEFDSKLTNKCADLEAIRNNSSTTIEALKTVESTVVEQTKSINEMKSQIGGINSDLTKVQSTVNDHTGNLDNMSEKLTEMSGNLLKVQDAVENFSKIIDRVYNLISMVDDEELQEKIK